jgi:hypothetical protein
MIVKKSYYKKNINLKKGNVIQTLFHIHRKYKDIR